MRKLHKIFLYAGLLERLQEERSTRKQNAVIIFDTLFRNAF
jgi:hypothetical protein